MEVRSASPARHNTLEVELFDDWHMMQGLLVKSGVASRGWHYPEPPSPAFIDCEEKCNNAEHWLGLEVGSNFTLPSADAPVDDVRLAYENWLEWDGRELHEDGIREYKIYPTATWIVFPGELTGGLRRYEGMYLSDDEFLAQCGCDERTGDLWRELVALMHAGVEAEGLTFVPSGNPATYSASGVN